jgi:NAD(P) transhydrogenase subunit beta
MALAIGATLWKLYSVGRMPLFYAVLGGIVLGSSVGCILAVRASTTAVPKLVALLNSAGGLAAVLVAGAFVATALRPTLQANITVALAGLAGSVAFAGSALAYAKLQDFGFLRRLSALPGKRASAVACGVAAIGLSVWLVIEGQRSDHPEQYDYFYAILSIVSALFGIALVLPVAAADVPVAVALSTSCSGLAAAAMGFAIANEVLIVAGGLIAASAATLARMICKR